MTSATVIACLIGAGIGALISWLLTRAQSQAAHARLTGESTMLRNRIEELTRERDQASEGRENAQQQQVKLAERLACYQQVDQWARGAFSDATTHGLKPVETSLVKLQTHIDKLTTAKDELRSETVNLASCFKITSVRGRWGEVTLRRVAELSGLQEGVDYQLQKSQDDARPDMVVSLPRDRQLVIDAKVPGAHYAKAMEARDEQVRQDELNAHAKSLRERIRELSQKEYQRQFESLDCVVLFIPSEALFAAALESDPGLLEYALAKNVMVATPATIVGIMRVIEYTWKHARLEESTEQVHQDASELYNRVRIFLSHLGKVESGLQSAVKGWNDAIGSYQSRLQKQGERLAEHIKPSQEAPALNRISESVDPLPVRDENRGA